VKILRTCLCFPVWLLWVVSGACRPEAPATATATGAEGRDVADGVRLIGRIANPRLTESSGLAICAHDTNVFWTHNDGHHGVLFGFTRAGKSVAEFPVGILLHDWEDLARDQQGHLYIGDIGNNDSKRNQLAVHQIDEPDPKESGKLLLARKSWQLRFPNKPFDCESLFIWNDHGYVISKVFDDQHAEIYSFPLVEQKAPAVLQFVARLPIKSPATGANISADGKKLAVVCKSGAYVFRIKGEVERAGDAKFHYTRFRDEHIESCCFVPDGLLTTAESREIYLFTDEAFRR